MADAPAVAAPDLATLRRMVAEPTSGNGYTDEVLTDYIRRYPLLDERGIAPYVLDASTTPPGQDWNPAWATGWDLNAAAADVWEEKAAAVVANYDFSADGANYRRSQVYEQMMARVRYHRARRAPTSATAHKWPAEGADPRRWIGNLPEVD